MRIRKRWPPLSLPLPTPPPQRPDLPSSESPELRHRHDRSPEGNEKPPEKEDENQRRRSDLQLFKVSRTDGWIYSAGDDDVDVKNIDSISMHLSFNEDPPIGAEEEAAAESRLTAANRRFGYIPSPETSTEIGHWCEEDKTIPLKKRRVSIETKASEESMMEKEKESKTKFRARRKRKRKWVDSEDDKEEEKDQQDGIAMKKRESGSRKMDVSRCSRVNGRGWRCCEQTLVGYSLCEHHLGKGRVRSVSSVRSRSRSLSTAPTDKPKKIETSSFNEEDEEEYDDDDEVEKGIEGVKKRKKIGVVKARSMSSLLGQTVPLPPLTLLPPTNDNDDSLL